ncbi:hypothetical protein DL96DRAFT_1561827 [Flagelloscypha sp. PMI_526]|nr:hypothetical protein DL96DRAFT_1561827 [Flagelloscypha sp. PMI_526]
MFFAFLATANVRQAPLATYRQTVKANNSPQLASTHSPDQMASQISLLLPNDSVPRQWIGLEVFPPLEPAQGCLCVHLSCEECDATIYGITSAIETGSHQQEWANWGVWKYEFYPQGEVRFLRDGGTLVERVRGGAKVSRCFVARTQSTTNLANVVLRLRSSLDFKGHERRKNYSSWAATQPAQTVDVNDSTRCRMKMLEWMHFAVLFVQSMGNWSRTLFPASDSLLLDDHTSSCSIMAILSAVKS